MYTVSVSSECGNKGDRKTERDYNIRPNNWILIIMNVIFLHNIVVVFLSDRIGSFQQNLKSYCNTLR